MTNEKMIIQAQGDKLLLGAHFHELEDKSQFTFRTAQIESFVQYLAGRPKDEFHLMIDGDKISAEPIKRDRYTEPIAICQMTETAALSALRRLASAPQELQEMVDFMEIHKRFATAATLEVLPALRHFKLKKVIGVEVQQERNGNYHCAVSLENAGKDDWEPPASLAWEVPVFKHLLDQADSITLAFELNFRVTQANPPKLHFVLTNFAMDEEVLWKKKDILNRHLAALPQVKLWGDLNFSPQDDAWRYLQNPHPEGDAAKTALMLRDQRTR